MEKKIVINKNIVDIKDDSLTIFMANDDIAIPLILLCSIKKYKALAKAFLAELDLNLLRKHTKYTINNKNYIIEMGE